MLCQHFSGRTHTLRRSDVNRAGDVGEALVHAHLQVDHPEKQTVVTESRLTRGVQHIPTLPVVAALKKHKYADEVSQLKLMERSRSSPPTGIISTAWIGPSAGETTEE